MLIKPIVLLVSLLLLLGGASAASSLPGPDTAVTTESRDLLFDGVSPLTPAEMAALTGGTPSWVIGGCMALGGFTGGRALAMKLAKRAVISTVCPWCGVAVTVATIGCLLI